MKKLIIIIVALPFWMGAFSQSQIPWTDKNTESMMNGTPYIFEGEVIDTMYYNGCTGLNDLLVEYDVDGKPLKPIKPLTAIKVQINHIYRGNLNPGTVELVDEIGGFWNNGIFMHIMIGERDRPIQPSTKGIFFCKVSSFKPSLMKTDNEIRLISTGLIFFSPGGWIEGFNKVFHSKKELNDFLSKYPNITIPKEEIKEDK